MLETICIEMTKGNFSFAILVVGIIQTIFMAIQLFKKKGKQMEKYYKVSEIELKDLLYSYHKLMALECGGLDNWEWYSESIKDYLANGEEIFNDLDELVEKEIKQYKEVR